MTGANSASRPVSGRKGAGMARNIILVLGLVGIVGVSVTAGAREGTRPIDPAAQAALRYFESIGVTGFAALLQRLRRPAPPPSVRARVIKNLPVEQKVTPTVQEAAKLEGLLPVLAFHERDRVIDVWLGHSRGTCDRRVPRTNSALCFARGTSPIRQKRTACHRRARARPRLRVGRVSGSATGRERAAPPGTGTAVRRIRRHHAGSPARGP